MERKKTLISIPGKKVNLTFALCKLAVTPEPRPFLGKWREKKPLSRLKENEPFKLAVTPEPRPLSQFFKN